MKEIKDSLRKLEPIIGQKAKGLWYLNLFSEDKQLLRLLLDKKANSDFRENIRLPPPKESETRGEYYIGEIIYPEKAYSQFGLREDEFIKHILITGMTGSGKTNLSFHVLKELAKKNKPFLVFDWKRNYKDLMQLQEFKKLKIIRLGAKECEFRFNPLIPPNGVEPKHWMAMLIDIMKHAFFVGHGVEYFLRQGLDNLYKKYGIYEGGNIFPTLTELENALKRKYVKGREMLWMSSTKRVMSSLTFAGLLGEVLNSNEENHIDELLNERVIIEMDNLATIEKTFFVEALLLWIYEYRKLESKRETFKHCIVIEEAHHIVSKKKERTAGEETVIETILRMIREFGESVIVIDQEPQKVSDSILANTNCKICFTLGNGIDISTIGKAMNLSLEQQGMIDKLKTGHAIVKTKRFDEPVQVKFPHIKVEKGKSVNNE